MPDFVTPDGGHHFTQQSSSYLALVKLRRLAAMSGTNWTTWMERELFPHEARAILELLDASKIKPDPTPRLPELEIKDGFGV